MEDAGAADAGITMQSHAIGTEFLSASTREIVIASIHT
jgi:hypothetical protein